MNHDSRGPPPHTALKDYLAALQLSSQSSAVAVDEQASDNNNIEAAVSSSQTGKIPFILVDDNMKATPSFLLASTTPPKTVGRIRGPLNRTISLPTKVSGGASQPRKSSSSASTTTASTRKKSRSSGVIGVDKKTRSSMIEKSQSSSLVQLLHPIRAGKEKQDLLHHHDDDDHETTTKLWCRWEGLTSHGNHRHHDVDKNSKNDHNRDDHGSTPTGKPRRRKSYDQGVPLPTRTVEEEHDS